MNYKDTLDMDKYETSEVSNMKWKTYEECKDSIREYNLEKQNMLYKINNMLSQYKVILYTSM